VPNALEYLSPLAGFQGNPIGACKPGGHETDIFCHPKDDPPVSIYLYTGKSIIITKPFVKFI
jgi:hypothetical protein